MELLQKVFNYEGVQVRTIFKGEDIWFVAKDVCDVLDIKNVTQALQRLDEDERSMFNIGRQGNTNIVNESGLYELVFASRKPEARNFKRWIKRDVLPSIRQTGSYQSKPKPMTPSELALLQAQNIVALERKVQEQEVQIKQSNQRLDRVEQEQKNVSDIITLSIVEWRKNVNTLLNRMANSLGGQGQYQQIRNESYSILEDRARCKLSIRVENKKKNLLAAGLPQAKVAKVSKLDVISEDARLTEIYLAIVKEMAIKYRVKASDLAI